MLTYSEQLLLLSVDPVTGRPFPVPEQVRHLTLAGALMFDASFRGLINDDWEKLIVLTIKETGNTALDEALGCLQILPGAIPLDRAIALVAAHGPTLDRLVRESMLAGGLLKRKKTGSRKQGLFSPDLPLVVSIHRKIREAILQEEIPDAEIPPVINLLGAGGLINYILSPAEAERFKEKLGWLAGMESLGREIIRAVHALETADLERDAASLIGLGHDQPGTYAGGMDAVLSSFTFLRKETGVRRSGKIIGRLNQVGGFECPGCAWPNPDAKRSHFEFCENGIKNVCAEATSRALTSAFFEKWTVQDLLLTSGCWLEQQGRLTEPMLLDENAGRYRPVSWDEAFRLIAKELNSLAQPDEAVFYSSGRTSNEAAFLYQLFARVLGTNNLPNSANLCHEPSGKALAMSLGFGKSSVTPEDFPKADAIFIFGHNPGSNHPRMLSALQSAVRKGCKIVAVNPMPEASLMGFADPQEVGSYLGKPTKLAHLYLQPHINGDMALIRGMVKAILEEAEFRSHVLDTDFIAKFTSGFSAYKELVMATPWDLLVSASGLDKGRIVEAAAIYMQAKSAIATWCLGITHHRNSIATIREIINLMLLKGNVGRPGAGLCPVRGHSNVQGIRTSGAGESMPAAFLDSLEKNFAFTAPRKPGLNAIQAVRAMAEGKVRVLISLGGNLASALPDTAFAEEALRKCRLTVMISTKLNRSQLVTGKRALILPCLSRSDADLRNGENQYVTVEDAMGKIGFSRGCLKPVSPALKSEVSIVAGMAAATLGNRVIDWQQLGRDRHLLRQAMSQTIPALEKIHRMKPDSNGYYLDNPLKERIFNTNDQKAQFSHEPLETVSPEAGELLLMTIRSHDQFNTSVFGLNDRYRGISNERRVLFMNAQDMEERHIVPEQLVRMTTSYDNKIRKLEGYYAIPYPVSKGCVAAYFPETNVLTSVNNTNALCDTPAYKSVCIRVEPA